MKRNSIVLLVLGLLMGGCDRHSDESVDVESPGSSVAHVTRGARGGERWASTTAIPLESGNLQVDEVFDLNRQGFMTKGYIRIRDPQGSWNREVWFDPMGGSVVIRAGNDTRRFSAPPDSAWILAPLEGPGGRPLVTPLGAWITHRATMESSVVRLVDVTGANSNLVPSEQWSFPTDSGTTVIVGNSGADVDAQFISSLRDGQTELVRGQSTTRDNFVFHRIELPKTHSRRAAASSIDFKGGGVLHTERAAP